MIKYKYAKNENDILVNINNIDKLDRNKSKFFCIVCENELIAKLGKIKTHHFAHKNIVTCSGETYLHLLGKQIFFDNFTDCLNNKKPFFIELYQKIFCDYYQNDFKLNCNLEEKLIKFDITKFFNKIVLEKKEDSFIPDLMLISKSGEDKIFIEIAVTHLSNDKKLSSKYRIIEIKLNDEEDLEPIRNNLLSIKDENIKFKNFKTKPLVEPICNGNCKYNYNFLVLDHDGRCLLKQKNLKEIKIELSKFGNKIKKYKILDNEYYTLLYGDIFKINIAKFYKENLKVRNCFICRYHAENSYSDFYEQKTYSIFCKFLKIRCTSNQAVNCTSFRVEEKYVQDILEKEDTFNDNSK